MQTVHAFQDVALQAMTVVAKTDPDTALNSGVGDSLTTSLRSFIAPFIFIAIAGFSLMFLVRRQTSAFLGFIAISIGVLAVFYSPEILGSAGNLVASWFGGSTASGEAAGG